MRRALLLVPLLIGASLSAADLPVPVAAWTLDAVENGRVSGTGRARPGRGEVVGPVQAVPGVRGGALSFPSAESGVVSIPFDLALVTEAEVSVEFWYRPGPERPREYAVCVDAGASKGLVVRLNSRGRLSVSAGGRWNLLETPAALEPGRWRHVVVTHDGRTTRLYLDGREAAAGDPPQPLALAAPITLGARLGLVRTAEGERTTVIQHPLGGDLDEVRWYASALSAETVATLAERP